MKRKLTTLICLIMATIMGLACLSGCNLITTNNDRDLNQVIATVDLGDNEENIYKKDLIMQYLNYGYLYVQNYGYTLEKTYKLLFDNLITMRIMTQGAKQEFEKAKEEYVLDNSKAVGDPLRYLTKEEVAEAKYGAYSSMNSLLDTVLDNEEEKSQDSLIETIRTIPTNATNKQIELTYEEHLAYIEKGFDVSSDAEHRKAFNDVVDLLQANGLLDDKDSNITFDKKDLTTSAYFIKTLQSNYENLLLTKLEKKLASEARADVNFDTLEAEYLEAKNSQEKWSNSEFVNALSSSSVSSPVLYSSFGGYGYVHNLLLGVNEAQENKINAIRTENPNISNADYAEMRANILGSTLVKDLRSTWILSNYDAELRENELIFTGDYTFAKDKANSLAFQGSVNKIKDADEEKKTPAQYTVTDTVTFELDSFLSFMNSYLGGTATDNKDAYEAELGVSAYDAKKLSGVSEYQAKINELLFAFSTDDGSLNKHKGYVIKPAVDGANQEEFVETFGKAGRILLQQGEGYVVVASDYGYHIMFYTQSFTVDYSAGSLIDYLNKETGKNLDKAGWSAYFDEMKADWEEFSKNEDYLYLTADSLTSAIVTNAFERLERNLINANRYEESDNVVIYEDRFSDLWK